MIVNKLLQAVTYGGFSDPYIELRLQKADPVAGEQIQSTSKRPGTLDPTWVCGYHIAYLYVHHVVLLRC